MTAQPQRLGAEKEEKHINFQMGLYYAILIQLNLKLIVSIQF